MKFKAVAAAIILALFAVAPAMADYKIGYDETKSLFVNQTMLTYDRQHGMQVEFIGSNGKSYLLYPGNNVVLKGAWKLDSTKTPNVYNLCFKYGANTYNPATGQAGGQWECIIAGFYIASVTDHATGDVLGLSKRTDAPFILSRQKASLASLIRKLPR